MTENMEKHIATQLLSAVEYCHSKKILHLDIKPENILVTGVDGEKITVQLADFGLSTSSKHPLNRTCGTTIYMAPEVIESKYYEQSIDIWCLGATIYNLLTKSLPKYGSTKDLCFDDLTMEARDFIMKMLQIDPTKRSSASELLKHSWLTSEWLSESAVDEYFTNKANRCKQEA
ncbi:serine/threonine kinase [Thraustotheca clavata]|uniref:Serine/threonine kinase n=1 Tax=Thraustotheca clavata TaxID=74557 RepID=A0A1V9YT10_9STRA|nr:serine/threonine kinase [Thraustotheca clavata]